MSRTIETHSAHNPRILAFYGFIAALVLILGGGVIYRQLYRSVFYSARERLQSQRCIIVPGPRGNILDRNGEVLVGNRPRFSVVLDLAELRSEFHDEFRKISRNYRAFDKAERPSYDDLYSIARVSITQRYLDQVNSILGRAEKAQAQDLEKHLNRSLLLPYVLLDDLTPLEYARLIERLPVNSPLQVYTSSTRYYPYGSAASHVLGYTGIDDNPEVEDFGEDLPTFKMKGAFGRDGLEKKFESLLQGESGGAIYLVDPAGYKVGGRPKEERKVVQGKNLVTSLDIDLQLAAEERLGTQTGAAVAIDVRTGEVLVMTSKPDYDLNLFVPRLSQVEAKKISDDGAWLNQAIGGTYPPGSTFKLITSIAALRNGKITPTQDVADCEGVMMVGNKRFTCENGEAHHGVLHLAEAIARSCDIYFYQVGLLTTPNLIADEARRFHLDRPTGIELNGETNRMLIPDPAWKARTQNGEKWYPGDTANMAIGQGATDLTPLEMACFAASLARNELYTTPTILHDPNAPTQHAPPIGLTREQRAALLQGMEECTTYGTANLITKPLYKVPDIRIAGKTGTAQKRVRQGDKVGTINCAWFICFAPIEDPQIAVAVMIEGDTFGENFGGGVHSTPIASAILTKYFEKKAETPALPALTSK